MAKKKQIEPEITLEEQPEPAEEVEEPFRKNRLNRTAGLVALSIVLLVVALIGGFDLLYKNKVMPGVSVNGVYLGGLTKEAAIQKLDTQTAGFINQELIVQSGKVTLKIPVSGLDLKYDNQKAVELAMSQGRSGDLVLQLRHKARALANRVTNFTVYGYDNKKLSAYLKPVWEELDNPARDASLNFSGEAVAVHPSQPGRRLDVGRLAQLIQNRLGTLDESVIEAPVYQFEPAVDDASLEAAKGKADGYLTGPLELNISGRDFTVGTDRIVSWIKVWRKQSAGLPQALEFYAPPQGEVMVDLNREAIAAYVDELAGQTDQAGQDAKLAIQDERAVVFQPSRDGRALDRQAAIAAIVEGLSGAAGERALTLKVNVSKPAVREENLNDLGIKELISEGVSFFPGSTRERIQNVRTAAARYNGLLIKPDEVFSFGANLGDVGPETGYAPAKVIIGNRQELQYGGGICQVSSTMYRAALLAGLPITQRTNHSFAVSYYTAPFGVPGVDATIWYPQVDLKFKNDSGHHILVQTIIEGTTLRFQFYGTKVKEGKIRGPFFISGSNDSTQPSRTVFYRDVVVNGAVTETHSVYTSYKASTDFPDEPQFN